MTAFKGPQKWRDKVIDADSIWSQVKNILQSRGLELPETPRRPDVRLILDNTTGVDQMFRNPANHANDKSEHIPATGDKTATMVMVAGDTLAEQYANARTLFEKYDLGEDGLSPAFVSALKNDRAGGLVTEAYGPAPYAGQSGKLVDVAWNNADGTTANITPVFGAAGSYGARAATAETALRAVVHVYVKGTGTTPELMETEGMSIAVAKDWQSGAESTRPIVASVAREFYGQNYANIPTVVLNPDGQVRSIDLKNGTAIDLYDERGRAAQPTPKMA